MLIHQWFCLLIIKGGLRIDKEKQIFLFVQIFKMWIDDLDLYWNMETSWSRYVWACQETRAPPRESWRRIPRRAPGCPQTLPPGRQTGRSAPPWQTWCCLILAKETSQRSRQVGTWLSLCHLQNQTSCTCMVFDNRWLVWLFQLLNQPMDLQGFDVFWKYFHSFT